MLGKTFDITITISLYFINFPAKIYNVGIYEFNLISP